MARSVTMPAPWSPLSWGASTPSMCQEYTSHRSSRSRPATQPSSTTCPPRRRRSYRSCSGSTTTSSPSLRCMRSSRRRWRMAWRIHRSACWAGTHSCFCPMPWAKRRSTTSSSLPTWPFTGSRTPAGRRSAPTTRTPTRSRQPSRHPSRSDWPHSPGTSVASGASRSGTTRTLRSGISTTPPAVTMPPISSRTSWSPTSAGSSPTTASEVEPAHAGADCWPMLPTHAVVQKVRSTGGRLRSGNPAGPSCDQRLLRGVKVLTHSGIGVWGFHRIQREVEVAGLSLAEAVGEVLEEADRQGIVGAGVLGVEVSVGGQLVVERAAVRVLAGHLVPIRYVAVVVEQGYADEFRVAFVRPSQGAGVVDVVVRLSDGVGELMREQPFDVDPVAGLLEVEDDVRRGHIAELVLRTITARRNLDGDPGWVRQRLELPVPGAHELAVGRGEDDELVGGAPRPQRPGQPVGLFGRLSDLSRPVRSIRGGGHQHVSGTPDCELGGIPWHRRGRLRVATRRDPGYHQLAAADFDGPLVVRDRRSRVDFVELDAGLDLSFSALPLTIEIVGVHRGGLDVVRGDGEVVL